MKDLAFHLRGIGKQFEIGTERRKTVFQQLRYWVRGAQPTRTFWALKDIDLDIRRGMGFGVMGPNGTGKTTLLRIMAGILQPTEGVVRRNGQINPFMALGVELLPQLTVLENLRLCAALLGYSGKEFRNKLDAIIDFSEVKDYLYAALADLSSGWAGRVSFSIALHAELDILLVDESLSAGDAYFVAKCKRRFDEIRKQNKTIVLVSHSPENMKEMCSEGIYIEKGRAMAVGPIDTVYDHYARSVKARMIQQGLA
ncbi:MAG TPA: ATP-binding cassette domain-containing protein [Elusimicrobiota bacterium]|nr:ATP-binding cassette domain-containing protein [Elusimicrobiota bacterium]